MSETNCRHFSVTNQYLKKKKKMLQMPQTEKKPQISMTVVVQTARDGRPVHLFGPPASVPADRFYPDCLFLTVTLCETLFL